jgi:hypothetical protein
MTIFIRNFFFLQCVTMHLNGCTFLMLNLGCQGQGKSLQLVGANKMMGSGTMSQEYHYAKTANRSKQSETTL